MPRPYLPAFPSSSRSLRGRQCSITLLSPTPRTQQATPNTQHPTPAMNVYSLLPNYSVLDLSRTLPGPFCTWLLAGLGAHVLAVVDPKGWDVRRGGHDGLGAREQILYRNKRRLTLNLKSEEGRQIFFRLLDRADVVMEDFRPGVATRLGVDYAALSAVRPEVVYCSISSFGQDGPYRNRPAHDLNCLALAGCST